MKKDRARRRLDPPATNHESNHDNLPHLLPGLTRLAEQLLRARARQDDPWLHSLSASDLAPLGLRLPDLRTLNAQGYIEAREVRNQRQTPQTKKRRTEKSASRPGASATTTQQFGPHTPFILTDTGLAFVTKQIIVAHSAPAPSASASADPGQDDGSRSANGSVALSLPQYLPPSPMLPHYNSELRELSVADVVVLRIPVQGHNLAAVLRTLELSGWKPRVDKPLNGRPDGADPAHLANAAYSLNVRQSLIEFHADGGAIRWGWRPSVHTAEHTSRKGCANGSTRGHPRSNRREKQ